MARDSIEKDKEKDFVELTELMLQQYQDDIRQQAESTTTPDRDKVAPLDPETLAGRRSGMVVFSYYPQDPRVKREAEALTQAGMKVEVYCLRRKGQKRREVINGVTVVRMRMERVRAGKLRYLWQYAAFTLRSFLRISFRHLRRRFDVVHVHNMPDILILSALLPRLTGAKVILDLHDPMPEVFMTKFNVSLTHPLIRLIKGFERLSIGFANIAITPNKAFREVFIQRGCPPEKMKIVMNSPDESVFCGGQSVPVERFFDRHRTRTLMYHGTVVERHGLDVALKALTYVRTQIPTVEFHVYGGGEFVHTFLEQRNTLGLQGIVHYHGEVSQEEIARAIQLSDVGIIPNKMSPFTDLNLPTRIMEYLSLRKPVVAPRTRGITDYFTPDTIEFFDAGNAADLARAILALLVNADRSEYITDKGHALYRQYRWNKQRLELIDLVKKCLK